MKRKLLLTLLLVSLFMCVLAISVCAFDYRVERTYNYYENEIADSNLLFTAKTKFAIDANNADLYRYEVITSSSGVGFAKFDSEGNALTWYVYSDDLDSDGNYIRNIVVKSCKTIGEAGTMNSNGSYSYGNGTIAGITAKTVVSANFFGTGVKSLPGSTYTATAVANVPNGSTSEYSQMADGSYLLGLYLPKTLTSVPGNMCVRTPLIWLEFEDNVVSYTTFTFTNWGNNNWVGAFAFCPNLKAITIPEGITGLSTKAFRECISLDYIKFPSTMTRVENDLVWRGGSPRTVIYGDNMVFVGYLNSDPGRFYVEDPEENARTKFYYVPNTINTAGSNLCDYRSGVGKDRGLFENTLNDLVFFFAGNLDEARTIAALRSTNNWTNGKTRENVNHLLASFDEATALAAGIKFNQPITYETYLTNTNYYNNLEGYLMVYNAPSVNEFSQGVHRNQKWIDCTENLTCDICNAFLKEKYDEHNNQLIVEYANGYASKGYKIDGCTRCSLYVECEAPALFTCLGYSAPKYGNGGIAIGYTVDKEAMAEYAGVTEKTFKYGLFAVSQNNLGANDVFDKDGTAADGVINADLSNHKFSVFELKITGFKDEQKDIKLALGAYVYVIDGDTTEYSYIQYGTPNEGEKYVFHSFNDIVAICAAKE